MRSPSTDRRRQRVAMRARLTTFTVIALVGCGGSEPESAEQTAGGPTSFVDEFSGTAIDRSKWTVYTGTVYNSELQQYVDDGTTISIVHGTDAAGATDGALLIQARHRPSDVAPDFISGRLHGRLSFRYGSVAARIKLPAGAGLWPAFWLLGNGPWPHHGEIDVMENVGDPAWVSAAIHGPGYSGNTPFNHRTTLPDGDITEWHEYAVTWTADSIVFRVDDVPVYRVRRAEVAPYGSPGALDSLKYVVLNLAIGGEYPAAVNGVRSPMLGLPESTLPLIQNGDAKMYVDWVRASW